MHSYLKNRSQRVSINSSFSTWEEIIAGVPQGSILGPLLFNIFLNDIFYFENRSYLSNYADDNVLYAFGSKLEEVKQIFFVNLRTQSKYDKIRTRENSVFEHFSRSVIYTHLFMLIYTYLSIVVFSLYYYTELITLIKYGKYRNYEEIF